MVYKIKNRTKQKKFSNFFLRKMDNFSRKREKERQEKKKRKKIKEKEEYLWERNYY